MIHISDDTFDKFVTNEKNYDVVIVDCSASWCGPCKIMAKRLSEWSDEKVSVCKLDIEESPDTALKFGVTSIPTLLFFKNGVLSHKSVGLCTIDEIKKVVEKL